MDSTPLTRIYIDALRSSLTFRIVSLSPAVSLEKELLANRYRHRHPGTSLSARHPPPHPGRGAGDCRRDRFQHSPPSSGAVRSVPLPETVVVRRSLPENGPKKARWRPLDAAPGNRNLSASSNKFYAGLGIFVLTSFHLSSMLAALGMSREGRTENDSAGFMFVHHRP